MKRVLALFMLWCMMNVGSLVSKRRLVATFWLAHGLLGKLTDI